MRKLGWIAAFVLVLTVEVPAQVDTAWVRTFPSVSTEDEGGIDIALSPDGAIYVTGGGLVTLKYSRDGQLIWSRPYAGVNGDSRHRSIGLEIDPSGNLIVCGWTPGPILLKYNPDGDLLWERQFPLNCEVSSFSLARHMTLDRNGSVVVTGKAHCGGTLNAGTLKFDTNGDAIWYRTWNVTTGFSDEGVQVLSGENEDTFVAARRCLDGSCGTEILHYSPVGDLLWSLSFPYINPERPIRMCISQPGQVTLSGNDHDGLVRVIDISDAGELASERVLNTSGMYGRVAGMEAGKSDRLFLATSEYDMTTASLFQNRTTEWVRGFDGPAHGADVSSALCLDRTGAPYVTGHVAVSSGWRSDWHDVQVVSYGASGDILWSYRWGPTESDEEGRSIVVGNDFRVYVTGFTEEGFVTMALTQSTPVTVDNLPNTCPNIINTGISDLDYHGIRPGPAAANRPTVPVAILGTSSFDASRVDPSTIEIAGLSPSSHRLLDVSRPVDPRETECECTTAGADGYTDLVLYFDQAQFVAALGPVNDGEVRTLELTGKTKTGVPLSGSDCVTIKEGPTRISTLASAGEKIETGFAAYPNPFNAATVVSFYLATESDVRLDVYDVLGRRVATLVDDMMPAGEHQVNWDAAGVASGVYFARLATSAGMMTRKMVLVR